MVHTWNKATAEKANNAIQLARSAEAGIPKALITELDAAASDINRPEYMHIKKSIEDIAISNDEIRFAYIMVERDDKILFLADSEPVNSEDYSPPGQEYWEADEQIINAFKLKEAVLTEPSTDRWGSWVSVFVPMQDENGEIIAIFGVDYPAENWSDAAIYETCYAGITILSLFLIFVALFVVVSRNRQLSDEKVKMESLSKRLEANEILFRTVFEQAPIGIAIGHNYKLISKINPMFESILGRTKEELTELSWIEFTHPDDLEKDLDSFSKLQSGNINSYSMQKRFIKPDSSVVWVNMTVATLSIGSDEEENQKHLCLIEDITDRLTSEWKLMESERSKTVLLSHIPGMAYRCRYDLDWTMEFASKGCHTLTGYNADSLINNKDVSFNEIIAPEYRGLLLDEWARVLPKKESFRYEYEIITASSERKWVLELGQGIYDKKDNVEALEGIIIDITQQKKRESQIRFMLNHDHLTGLYNRKHYEEEMHKLDIESKLPFTIVLADINGVRLINDAFGYIEGDKLIKQTASILRKCCRQNDVLARIGGDEFGILMPNTDSETAYEFTTQIQGAFNEYNKSNKNKLYELNISTGFDTKVSIDDSIEGIAKSADEYLRYRKLLNRNSFHSEIIASIMSTMYEKSEETEEHARRLSKLSKEIGERLSLSQKSIGELELLSMLHDIGKVGIDDRILKNPGS